MATDPATANRPATDANIEARRRAMALIAEARADDPAAPIADVSQERAARDLKPVETGLVMLRGRAGGDGAPFNLGEATVTRAVVEIDDGLRGYGHVLVRGAEQARRVAILDALCQAPASRDVVEAEVLSPIAERIAAERARAGAATAATRVDFFTLV